MPSIFADLSVKDVFPTPIWVADLDPHLATRMNAELETAIKELVEPRPQIPLGSTWQTTPVLHKHDRFAEFCALVRKAGAATLAFLDLKNRDFDITGCWANINPTGGLNSPHTHPNNFLSGVYYVSIPGNSGQIVFADPRPQAASILPPADKWNKYVGNEIKLEVKAGRMVIFPAWLVHSVPVNRSAEERISISFNLMFKDFTESVSKPLWTGTAPIRR